MKNADLIPFSAFSYATIVSCQFLNILSRIYNYESLFARNFWRNKKVVWSIVISLGLSMEAIYTPSINTLIEVAPLNLKDWLTIVASADVFLFAYESRCLNDQEGNLSLFIHKCFSPRDGISGEGE